MNKLVFGFSFFLSLISFTQKSPADFGYRHLQLNYKSDLVDVLVASKKGEEEKPKPIFLFCQGSLTVPGIVYDETGATSPFPFSVDLISQKFHLVYISKPGVPVIAKASDLNPDYTYADSSGTFPTYYLQRNYLDYYVNRNTEIIKQLQKLNWVSKNQLVVAGHSEGATIAAKLALENKSVTHVIFASGNPMGRIMSMIERSRKFENDSTNLAENDFGYWEYLIQENEKKDSIDPYAKTDYSFSIPSMDYLKKLKIPVLITYGSSDYSTAFNDYFRVWCTQNQKSNIEFKSYVGLEHNYFGTDSNRKPDYNQFNWDKVATDWYNWVLSR
jgi:dienelactone hydrolase